MWIQYVDWRQQVYVPNGLPFFSFKTNILYVFIHAWPPLWSSGQSSWLQIQRSRYDSRRYQIFWEAVGLERGPLSLESTIEELLGRNSSGSGVESREYGCRDMSRWPRGTLCLHKLALNSTTSGGRSVDIVGLSTQTMEFVCLLFFIHACYMTELSIIVEQYQLQVGCYEIFSKHSVSFLWYVEIF
jgi:hypothetical protein